MQQASWQRQGLETLWHSGACHGGQVLLEPCPAALCSGEGAGQHMLPHHPHPQKSSLPQSLALQVLIPS